MPRITKDSHEDELEAPRVDEYELDDRAQLKADDRDHDDEDVDEEGIFEEGIVEDIDLDDLVAMEGPDA